MTGLAVVGHDAFQSRSSRGMSGDAGGDASPGLNLGRLERRSADEPLTLQLGECF